MRPQASPIQESGEQKKSVFDRLGRQLDTSRQANRGSPMHYGEHPMHPMMHDADFSRFGRGEQPADINWRYQNDRRHMGFSRDRPPFAPQFDMNMPPGRQPPPPPQYFPHPHGPQHFHGSPGGPPAMMGPDVMAMGMHQRRPSPKYDRHGNPIRVAMPMDMPSGMSPPRNFMGQPHPGSMMHPPSYDMVPMSSGMYPPNRWHEGPEMGPPMHGRSMQDEQFMDAQRFQQQPKGPVMMSQDPSAHQPAFDAPRYSKWRERRDVITNLDRQTAQSSSKTDSLKSSLQEGGGRSHFRRRHNRERRQAKKEQAQQANAKKAAAAAAASAAAAAAEPSGPATKVQQGSGAKSQQSAPPKADPGEISDGEIIDDEDSSDESDNLKTTAAQESSDRPDDMPTMSRKTPYGRIPSDEQHYYEAKKRRRLHDRDDYPMDYETISDEELDDFISDKKLVDEAKLDGSADGKSSSEIELLNALGLDWANLIELSKQSRKEAPTSGSALRRFSMPNYLPTLGITRELAGPVLYNYIQKVCH